MAGSGTAHLRDLDDLLLRVEHLVVEFPAGRSGVVRAVSDVSFDVRRGETLGLVGESGCGKSTTARAVMRLVSATSGRVILDGVEISALGGEALRQVRPRLQMIFQNPISSLNPRRRIRDVVGEGLTIWGRRRDGLVNELMQAVGLDPATQGGRRPHEFSGGQCQRISIARALAIEPDVIVCDEPVSALDVSVQAQILNLLHDMKERYGLTLVFIAHDLAVVKNISDRVAVMYLGKLCEVGPSDAVYESPCHPYTRVLLDAVPNPDPERAQGPVAASGDIPSPIDPPSGCRFRTRCPAAQDRCRHEEPQMQEMGRDHFVACHFPTSTPRRGQSLGHGA